MYKAHKRNTREVQGTKLLTGTGFEPKGLGMISGIMVLVMALIGGCSGGEQVVVPFTQSPTRENTPTVELPTPTPLPKTLMVCLGSEPESLYRYSEAYLYGPTSREADAVLQALYDGPIDVLEYRFQPVILEKLPSLEEGDARIEVVGVGVDQVFYDPVARQPANLEIGDTYRPSGCVGDNCLRTYGGGTVEMDRMVVEYHLLPELRWSDGEPLTASDSAFAYQIDLSGDTPTPKHLVNRTQSYEALDDRTAVWTGIPGYLDPEFPSNFWPPLPQHQLSGIRPADLQSMEEVNRAPLGWGPYVVDTWEPGAELVLRRNPNYFRAAEGLPHFDLLVYRFLGRGTVDGVDQLLTEECDVLDETALTGALDLELVDPELLGSLEQLAGSGDLTLQGTPGAEMERWDFNLNPRSGSSVPGWLLDLEMRQLLASCVDRERVVQGLLVGFGSVPDGYLPPSHPDSLEGLTSYAYEPERVQARLLELGWQPSEGEPDVPWIARGVAGVRLDTPLSFSASLLDSPANRELASRIAEDLAGCGFEVQFEYLSAAELFQPWPEGPVFGRSFTSVLWPWPSWVSPLCEAFAGWEIPEGENPRGVNVTGFQKADYDQGCARLLSGLPENPAYQEGVAATQRAFVEGLPSLPLFMRPRIVAHRPELCGVQPDPTAFSALWNVEIWAMGEDCQGEGNP